MGGFWSDNVPEETLSRDEAKGVLKRLFAMLRERAGAGELTLELPDGARVSDALAALPR